MPILVPGGFWSLTMYDKNCFYVANPINRYSISARQNLKSNPDGSVDMVSAGCQKRCELSAIARATNPRFAIPMWRRQRKAAWHAVADTAKRAATSFCVAYGRNLCRLCGFNLDSIP